MNCGVTHGGDCHAMELSHGPQTLNASFNNLNGPNLSGQSLAQEVQANPVGLPFHSPSGDCDSKKSK